MSVIDDDDDDEQIAGLREDGRPDPAYAAALGLIPAPSMLRGMAFAIDACIVVLLAIPLVIGTIGVIGAFAVIASAEPGVRQPGDGSLLAAVFGPLLIVGISSLAVYLFELVQLILHGIRGITVGKAICGIRSVRVTTFAKPGFWRVVLRALVVSAAFVVVPVAGALVFLLSPLWDGEERGRGWHDRIAGNWLLDVRRGLDPFDKKALRLARKRVATPEKTETAALPSLATGTPQSGFVPGARSSSGVVGFAAMQDAVAPRASDWTPPPVGEPVVAPAAAPAASAPTASAPPAPSRVATFVFDDGTAMIVDGGGLLGRNPQPHDGEDVHHVIAVKDDSLQISKTHVQFGLDAGGIWITDRGSVNGTTVVESDGTRRELVAGDRYSVRWGSIVEIGGRAFRVVQHAAVPADRPPRPHDLEGAE